MIKQRTNRAQNNIPFFDTDKGILSYRNKKLDEKDINQIFIDVIHDKETKIRKLYTTYADIYEDFIKYEINVLKEVKLIIEQYQGHKDSIVRITCFNHNEDIIFQNKKKINIFKLELNNCLTLYNRLISGIGK